MSRDPLTGFAGPTLAAAVVTGIAASWAVVVIALFGSGGLAMGTHETDGWFMALTTVSLIGLGTGAVIVWPVCLVMSFVGIKLMATRAWASQRRWWAVVGAGTGAILILLPYLSPDDGGLILGWIALYGAGCGALAGWLCHRWIGIEPVTPA